MPYLTPESTPESATCRALLIPDSAEWLAIFSGALTELSYRYNWEQQGIPVSDALAVVYDVLQGYYEGCAESGCTQPESGFPLFRLNEDGHVEMLVNGEWAEPSGEWAIPAIPARIDPTAEERRCQASANAVYVLEQVYEEALDLIALGVSITDFVAGIIEVVGTFAIVAGTITSWFAGLWITAWEWVRRGLTQLTVDLWDATFSEDLQCLLYECSSDSAGVVTFDYECIQAGMNDPTKFRDMTIDRWRLLLQLQYITMNIGGADGINQAGTSTVVDDDDCDACPAERCMQIDFRITDGSEYGVEVGVGGGTWVSGMGWEGLPFDDGEDVTVVWRFPLALTCTAVESEFTKVAGSGAFDVNNLRALNPLINYAATQVAIDTTNDYGTELVHLIPLDNVELEGFSHDVNSGSTGGTDKVYIHRFIVRWVGALPEGWIENCPEEE